MIEKRLIAVAPQLFTTNGKSNGVITVADACIFKVKQAVVIDAATVGPTTDLEVKRIPDDTHIEIGPKTGNIDARSDLSAYTVALGANIFANEQKRPSIPFEEFTRAVYEEEPTVATRVIMVDQCGDKYGPNNPLPIAFDGTIAIGDVSIKDSQGDQLEINNDGSINVNVVSSPSSSPGLNVTYNSVSAVASGVETTLVTMVAPSLGMKFYKIEVSGDNVSLYRVKINSVVKFSKRTFFGGNLNESFIFEPFENGLELNSGDILQVTVIHNRPSLSNYEISAISINL